MEGAGGIAGRVLRHPAVLRPRDLPRRAAHAVRGEDRDRTDPLHARRHRDGPPGLAVDRRPPARIDLGPRQLRRARLVGGLAAPRSHRECSTPGRNARPASATPTSTRPRRPRCRRSSRPRCAATRTTRTRAWSRFRRIARPRSPPSPTTISACSATTRASTRCARSTRSSDNPIPDAARRQAMTAFFFWSSWSTVTNRPGQAHQLHQQLAVGAAGRQRADGADLPVDLHQHPRPARRRRGARLVLRRDSRQGAGAARFRTAIRCAACSRTPSMKATAKYFWVVTALFLVQIVLGGITAHYAVEGQGFYGFPLSELPALRGDAHLAPAARGAVDRDRVARHGPVHRARRSRATSRSSSGSA